MKSIILFLIGCFGFTNPIFSDELKTTHIEGEYSVQSIERKTTFEIIRFQKAPALKGAKTIILETNLLNSDLLHVGDVMEISAAVKDRDQDSVEAEEVLLHLPRVSGKIRVWLVSRSGKALEFQGSLLKMHTTSSDVTIL